MELAGPVPYQSLEVQCLSRTPLAYLCLLSEGLYSEVLVVMLEPYKDHADKELHGHLEEHASMKHPWEVVPEAQMDDREDPSPGCGLANLPLL